MNNPQHALTLQLLEWIASRPRTYADVLEAWRTSCPRLSIWEDANDAGLIDRKGAFIALTPQGQSMLGESLQPQLTGNSRVASTAEQRPGG